MNSSAPPRLSTSNASITFSLDSSILQAPPLSTSSPLVQVSTHFKVPLSAPSLNIISSSSSLVQVSNHSTPLQPSSLSNWATTLLSAHSHQLEVNKVVARYEKLSLNNKVVDRWTLE